MGLRRRVHARRPDARLGRLRQDGPALGRRLAAGRGPRSPARPRPSGRVAFSPDGKTLASAGADRVATLWDLADRSPRSPTFEGHRGTIRALAFAPTASSSRRPARTARSSSGTRVRPRAGHADRPRRHGRVAWPSPRRARRSPPAASTRPSSSGTRRPAASGPRCGPRRRRLGPGLRPGRPAARLDRLRRHRQALGRRRADALGRRHARLPRRGPGRRLRARRQGPLCDRRRPAPRRLRPGRRPPDRQGPARAAARAWPSPPTAGRRPRRPRRQGPPGRRLDPPARSPRSRATPARSAPWRSRRGGKILASGGVDGRVVLWDVASRSTIADLADLRRRRSLHLRFSPDGATLAVGRRGPVGRGRRSSTSPRADVAGRSPGRGRGRRLGRLLARRSDDRHGRRRRHDHPVRRLDPLRAGELDHTPRAGRSPSAPTAGSWRRAIGTARWCSGMPRTGLKLATLSGPLRAGLRAGLRPRRPDGRLVGHGRDGPALEPGRPQVTPRASLNGELACIGPVVDLARRPDPGRGRGRRRLARPHRPLGRRRPTGPGHAPRPRARGRLARLLARRHDPGIEQLGPDDPALGREDRASSGRVRLDRGRRPARLLARRQDPGLGRRGQGR